MKSRIIPFTLFAAVILSSVLAIAAQRRARAALQNEAAELRRDTAALAHIREDNRRLVAEAARVAATPVAAPAATAETAPAPTAPATAAENRDPTQGMVAAEHLQSVGHATPAAAFQTMVWAALNGQNETLNACFSMSDAARAKLAGVLARLDQKTREKFTVPESIPAMLLAEEMLKKVLRLHITGIDTASEDAATAHTKITTRVGRINSQSFPMRRVNGRWTVALDDQMVDSMIRSLSRKEQP